MRAMTSDLLLWGEQGAGGGDVHLRSGAAFDGVSHSFILPNRHGVDRGSGLENGLGCWARGVVIRTRGAGAEAGKTPFGTTQ